jgi:4a-hydroxytetrahydrobiopterin dehydratase
MFFSPYIKYNGNMAKLKDMKCIPCEERGMKPLSKILATRLLAELSGWALAKNAKYIEKELVFKNFDKAMDFVTMVADLAEFEGHHPDIDIRYNKVHLVLSTHSIGGLSENDFILASKIDGINL